jgi:hypothetical protein
MKPQRYCDDTNPGFSLDTAMFCVEPTCEQVFMGTSTCPKCGSAAVVSLKTWLDRKPVPQSEAWREHHDKTLVEA